MVRFEPRGYSYKHLRSWLTSLDIFNWYINLITHCISSVMNLISKLQEVLKCPVPNCHLASLSFSLFSLDMDVSDCVFVGMGRSIPKWPKGRVWICNIWSRDQIWSRLVMMDHRLSHSLSLSSLSLSLSLSRVYKLKLICRIWRTLVDDVDDDDVEDDEGRILLKNSLKRFNCWPGGPGWAW